jgi:hypothetical protein
MTDTEIRQEQQLRTALRSAFMQCGMRFISPDAEATILAKLKALGVECNATLGYLRMNQGATEIAPSGMCERLRAELPLLFAPDPKRDAVSSKADLERGSAVEISAAKSQYIREHGLASWEALPATRAQSELQTAPVNPDMTKAQYLALPFSERVRLSGVFTPEVLARIIGRKG